MKFRWAWEVLGLVEMRKNGGSIRRQAEVVTVAGIRRYPLMT